MKFANETDLSVARDAVFAVVADQRNIPLWNYYVVDVRQERGDGPAVGARCFQQRKTDSHHTAIIGMDPGETRGGAKRNGPGPPFRLRRGCGGPK